MTARERCPRCEACDRADCPLFVSDRDATHADIDRVEADCRRHALSLAEWRARALAAESRLAASPRVPVGVEVDIDDVVPTYSYELIDSTAGTGRLCYSMDGKFTKAIPLFRPQDIKRWLVERRALTDAIAGSVPAWVAVADRLPKDGHEVLAWTDGEQRGPIVLTFRLRDSIHEPRNSAVLADLLAKHGPAKVEWRWPSEPHFARGSSARWLKSLEWGQQHPVVGGEEQAGIDPITHWMTLPLPPAEGKETSR